MTTTRTRARRRVLLVWAAGTVLVVAMSAALRAVSTASIGELHFDNPR